MQKNSWKEWFNFTRRERNAAVILLSLIAISIILPYLLPGKKLEIHIDKDLQAELDNYRRENEQQKNAGVYAANYTDTAINDTIKHELFYFDPNTLDEDGLVRLGLPSKTIRTLVNYRNKGGYFKKPEDIRKIYGLSSADADRLIPYVRIQSANKQVTFATEKLPPSSQAKQFAETNQLKKTEINTATVEDWKTFPGVGDVLANRIVKFRTSIGGFKTVDQVAKTYGLSDSVFQTIKPYLYIKIK